MSLDRLRVLIDGYRARAALAIQLGDVSEYTFQMSQADYYFRLAYLIEIESFVKGEVE